MVNERGKNIIIIVLLLIIAVMGFYMLNNKKSAEYKAENEVATSALPAADSTETKNETSSDTPPLSDIEVPEASPDQVCAVSLEKDTNTKGTKYQKGTILVSFPKETSLSSAENVVSSYNLTFANDENAPASESFAANHFLTANVPEGEEFLYICKLKKDTRISHVGLNVIFDLHQ